MPVTKTCANPSCGRSFTRPPSIAMRQKHCSKKCQERRTSYVCEVCGETRTVRPSQTAKRFCGDVCRLAWFSTAFVGEASPQWRGGSIENYGSSWEGARQAARERDQRHCLDCGVAESDLPEQLSVAHIIPFRFYGIEAHELANRIDNLRSLCRKCHLRFDHANGARARTDVLLAMDVAA